MDATTGKSFLTSAEREGRLVNAECGVRYAFRTTPRGYITICVWRPGKSACPVHYYKVNDEAAGMKLVKEVVDSAKLNVKFKAEKATMKKLDTADMRVKYKVGTLLVNSWGYDQTNIDYYEVIAKSKSGATVTLRAIASEAVPKEEGGFSAFMSQTVRPCPGKYTGEAFTKRVGPYGVSFPHGGASIIDADHTDYETSYA